MLRLVVLALISLLAACAARTVVDDPGMIAHLGFLNGMDVRRAHVEARLGTPAAIYEDGTVVSYTLYLNNNILSSAPSKSVQEHESRRSPEGPVGLRDPAGGTLDPQYALLLEYDANGRLVRHALLRRR